MTKQTQADNVIHEDQLRNFLVNELTGTFGISIAGNGDIESEDIYEVLVGATADGTSISTLCDRSEESDSGNDILYHRRTKLDRDTVRSVGNTLLREHTLEILPEQVEIVVDFHLRPYYGDECVEWISDTAVHEAICEWQTRAQIWLMSRIRLLHRQRDPKA